MREGDKIDPRDFGWVPEKVGYLLPGEHIIRMARAVSFDGQDLMTYYETYHILIRKERDGSIVFLKELSGREVDAYLENMRKLKETK